VSGVFADLGIDISQSGAPSQSTWDCFKKTYGDSFAIVQAWDGGYQISSHVTTAVADAWNAGLAHVDVYAFMCPNCAGNSPPNTAVSSLVNYLKSHNVKYGQMWFDVEQCTGCWGSCSDNWSFLTSAVKEAQDLGVSVGIYSSEYEWQQTVCDNTGLHTLPLWYASWDGVAGFNNPSYWSFGGWTSPAMKQYADSGDSSCGYSVDLDYYPS